ncbi:copper resistance system multicopper oxidase [Luteimonas sp. MC1750]|uniref:copper resistance system multicopper oxidase n=1 Tax=Luteimonas sp. MC1750 TaxID=2799326 RepID=UPI0018F06566|nr:copper resistance system multicopper oxidase [Luteimonas sp. MC1750]MBJ6984689.1 copper resistance system multicopper oxidase [Luteimonas sp. MC1750]QQO04714.1 copper resistance system multicopper oxidase [Luteimonas sp. MC1750]
MHVSRFPRSGASIPRRRFVQGLAGGGALAALGLGSRSALAVQPPVPVLAGSRLDLSIGRSPADFTGRPRLATTVNGSLPGPTLRMREGDNVLLRVANRLRHDWTSIHWHGLLLPANMDGVPGLSFDGIAPGEAWEYRFDVRQSGTYWYHSHSMFQEQAGLYGALVIDPIQPPPYHFDREHVVLLSDWTDMDPTALFRRMKKDAGYDNWYRPTVGDLVRHARANGVGPALRERAMWDRMRMTPSDISDINGHTYTYLLNGTAPAGNWTGLFRPGERVLLRFINASAMTYFDVRIPGLELTVVAADGQYIHPVTVDEFRIAAAETFDVLVEPAGADAFAIFAQDSGRTGYARGTLAVRHGLVPPVPALDPRPLLTMDDMGHGGMDHGGMDHGAMDHGGMQHASTGSAPMDHAGMDHGGMDHAGMDHAGMDHVAMGHGPGKQPADSSAHGMQRHPDSERGNPLVDMQAMSLAPRLEDPGVGLRGNGRTVLTYGAMRSLFDDPDGRDPGREVELHLTGHMEKFAWSFDGLSFMDAEPLRMRYGERLRVTLVNDTMMSHPIHLHGMWSDVEDADGRFQLRKHTVDMPPGTRRSFRVRADALGRWAFHCHLLYHMEAGMMREVRVEEGA